MSNNIVALENIIIDSWLSQLCYKQNMPFVKHSHKCLVFSKNAIVSFATYYNVLSINKWLKYTNIENEIYLSIKIKGKFNVYLISYSFIDKSRHILSSFKVESDNPKEFKLAYPKVKDCLLSFELESLENDSVFYSGQYLAKTTKEIKDIHLSIGICTYKRESLIKNIVSLVKNEVLKNANSPLYNRLDVFISDNAKTLNEKELENDHIHIYQNDNVGGSGGFARTMIEASKFKHLTHLIIMDDDAGIQIEALLRTYYLLRILKDEYQDYFIGSAMFDSYKPYVQHCSGERFAYQNSVSFINSLNRNMMMSDINNIIKSEQEIDVDYQAWWYCVIPINLINENNLPMPFFIKLDDIEYSLRNNKGVILLNGINVWHKSFFVKSQPSTDYYSVRNYLITCATLNLKISKLEILRMLLLRCTIHIVNYRYSEALLTSKGIRDFLKGPKAFLNLNTSEFNKYISGKYNNNTVINKSDLKDIDIISGLQKSKLLSKDWNAFVKLFCILTINGAFIPSKKYLVLNEHSGNCRQCFAKKYIYKYSKDSGKVFIYKKSLTKAILSLINCFITIFPILFKYKRVRKQFLNKKQDLYSYYSKN